MKMSKIIFQDEHVKISRLLLQEKALLITSDNIKIPENYHVVLEVKNSQIPYFDNDTTPSDL